MKILRPSLVAFGMLLTACSSNDDAQNPHDAGFDAYSDDDAPLIDASQDTSQADTELPFDGGGETSTPDAGPDAPLDGSHDASSCSGTWDIGLESTAKQICGTQPNCKVCVQSVDGTGTPIQWSALMDCPCPPTKVLDGGLP